jgi:hypothetical protein
MSSSTRNKAIEVWGNNFPTHLSLEKLSKILFSIENPPGTKYISGSQDSIGIVYPGLNRLEYDNDYWPKEIISINNEEIILWIENHLFLKELIPREHSYDVLDNTNINEEYAKELSIASNELWEGK